MRHRIGIAGTTGLGNQNAPELPNKGTLNKQIKEMLHEAFVLFPKLENGCDYGIWEDKIVFGREPAYYRERLYLICINKEKERSYICDGFAWGYYGTSIRRTTKYYEDYKRKSKFIRFIDKWHKKLFIQ